MMDKDSILKVLNNTLPTAILLHEPWVEDLIAKLLEETEGYEEKVKQKMTEAAEREAQLLRRLGSARDEIYRLKKSMEKASTRIHSMESEHFRKETALIQEKDSATMLMYMAQEELKNFNDNSHIIKAMEKEIDRLMDQQQEMVDELKQAEEDAKNLLKQHAEETASKEETIKELQDTVEIKTAAALDQQEIHEAMRDAIMDQQEMVDKLKQAEEDTKNVLKQYAEKMASKEEKIVELQDTVENLEILLEGKATAALGQQELHKELCDSLRKCEEASKRADQLAGELEEAKKNLQVAEEWWTSSYEQLLKELDDMKKTNASDRNALAIREFYIKDVEDKARELEAQAKKNAQITQDIVASNEKYLEEQTESLWEARKEKKKADRKIKKLKERLEEVELQRRSEQQGSIAMNAAFARDMRDDMRTILDLEAALAEAREELEHANEEVDKLHAENEELYGRVAELQFDSGDRERELEECLAILQDEYETITTSDCEEGDEKMKEKQEQDEEDESDFCYVHETEEDDWEECTN